VKWKSREKTERVPFVIYADFESCLISADGVLEEHVPSGFCADMVSVDFETEPVLYYGRDCMDVFTRPSRQAAEKILKDCHEMSPLTAEERERYDRAQSCSNCRETFSKDNYKVRHHNHRTGKFVGALLTAVTCR
jgi:hypothetical protein